MATTRTQAGNTDRLMVADLHRRQGRDLFGFARHLGLTEDEANDAAQEAILRLWGVLDAGQAVADPDAWTWGSARC